MSPETSSSPIRESYVHILILSNRLLKLLRLNWKNENPNLEEKYATDAL